MSKERKATIAVVKQEEEQLAVSINVPSLTKMEVDESAARLEKDHQNQEAGLPIKSEISMVISRFELENEIER